MAELLEVDKTKVAGYVRPLLTRKEEKIAKEEAELEEFIKAQAGEEAPATEEEAENATEIKSDEGTPADGDDSSDEKLSASEETFKKRYGDLRRGSQEHIAKLKLENEALAARLAEGDQGLKLPAKDEDVDAWSKKYPDISAIVQTLAAKEADKRMASANVSLEELKKDKFDNTQTKAHIEIEKVHSDFKELEASDEFHDWADDQPKWVQDALFVNSDDPRSVIRVLDLYKIDTGNTTAAAKAGEKAAATAVKTGNNKPAVDVDSEKGQILESEVAAMTDKQFEANEAKINEAVQNGKFVYDVSGAAR